MKDCRDLKDYAEYVDRVRRYTKKMDLEEAVERAITECIQEDVLKEFLEKNRAEVKKVSIYEAYNEIGKEAQSYHTEGPYPWAAILGLVVDKFGIGWALYYNE